MHTKTVYSRSGIIIDLVVVALVAIALLIIIGTSRAIATEPQTTSIQTSATPVTVIIDTTGSSDLAIVPVNYNFITEPGDNMSKLVRRAITLYDQSDDTSTFSSAQIIFMETNTVKELGPRLLDINQSFDVPRNLIEKYAEQATELSTETQSAWDRYAQVATFELGDITPTNVPLTDDGDLDTAYAPPTPPLDTTTDDSTATSTSSAYWWLAGLAVVVVLAFIFRPPRTKKS